MLLTPPSKLGVWPPAATFSRVMADRAFRSVASDHLAFDLFERFLASRHQHDIHAMTILRCIAMLPKRLKQSVKRPEPEPQANPLGE
jgi:hypothetical protein